MFKGTSVRNRDQHFGCREVFDNRKLNANPDHMLSRRGGLDLRTKWVQSMGEMSHEFNQVSPPAYAYVMLSWVPQPQDQEIEM